jgi:hypothetical protein
MAPRGDRLRPVRVRSYEGLRGKQKPRAIWIETDVPRAVLRILNRELESGPQRGDEVREWFQVLLEDGSIVWVCRKADQWFLLAE